MQAWSGLTHKRHVVTNWNKNKKQGLDLNVPAVGNGGGENWVTGATGVT